MAEFNKNWLILQEKLGYSFQDIPLLAEAMTHRSFSNEFQAEELPDNERLEFLGDAVLDLVVSQHLMSSHPDAPEGELTRIRAEVVAMPSLARLARKLDLGRCLMLGKGEERSGGRDKSNLLADALESLIGAIFMESGFDKAQKVVLPLFVPLLAQAAAREDQDFKSRLQEHAQAAQGELPVYKLVNATGPPHDRTYQVEVYLQNRLEGAGQGRSKKGAEQAAAEAALSSLDRRP